MSEPIPVAGPEWSAAVAHVIRQAEARGYTLVPHGVEPFGWNLYRKTVRVTHGHTLADTEALLNLLPTKTLRPLTCAGSGAGVGASSSSTADEPELFRVMEGGVCMGGVSLVRPGPDEDEGDGVSSRDADE